MNESLSFSLPFSNPVMIFALVMLIILLAPIIFKKLKVPGIVGIILAGTIVGPSVLGLLERDSTIELLGTVGLLYLMFMAGLSIDLNRFEKLRNRSIGFGSLSYFLPALGAYYAGIHLLDYSISTSLLLGAIVGSHTLLAYPIVERLGITKNTAVTMSMGGTLVTDSVSLGILAIIAGTAGESQGPGYWFGFITSIAIFLAAVIIILPNLGRWFFRNLKNENNTDYVFLLAVLFTTAFLAELSGLASIIGAFIAGLLLNRLVPVNSTLMSRVQFVGNALFIPFFLISVGMLVDVEVLTSLQVWIFAIVFSLLVFAGKGIASFLIQLMFKYSKAEGLVIFGLTTPQSAATLAVTLLGYDLGFFDQTAVNAVVIMILFTCLTGPWIVEKYGRMVAIQEEDKPFKISDFPQRILVPLANPETSDTLMDIAFMIRDEKSDQPVFPLTVARDGKDVEAQVARGEKMLSHAVIHAASAEIPVNPVTNIDLNIAKGISRAVSEKLGSTVVIGWNGATSAKQKIFGSILDQLLQEIDEMVMVCKIEKPINTLNRIVIAVPPFASLETGFSGAMRSVKLMTEQIGGELLVVCPQEREKYVMQRINKIKPEFETTSNTLSRWSDLPVWLDENIHEDDMFVLLSAREGTLSWRPGLDRLPRVVAKRYPDLCFISVYPTEVENETDSRENGLNLKLLNQKRIHPNLSGTNLEEALIEILKIDEDVKKEDIERLVRRLLKNSDDYSPEMMAGVIMYDAHTSLVSEQMLFIGISEKGLKVEKTANKVHVILILLSPKDMRVRDHLKGVNTVAKMIRPGKLLKTLKHAKTPDDVYSAIVKQ